MEIYKMKYHRRRGTLGYRCLLLSMVIGALVPVAQSAQDAPAFTIIKPEDIDWKENKTVPPGMLMFMMQGAPNKPGSFTFRAKIPAGYKLPPHRHPDRRTVTVLQGTYYSGVGETFDESRLIAFPPGSYYTTEANTPHFAMTKDAEVVIQEAGEGPNSGISYVNSGDDPRNDQRK
jgi:quercetin dioxygenase-like cupin family protein